MCFTRMINVVVAQGVLRVRSYKPTLHRFIVIFVCTLLLYN
jgi:hypothetical protein